jgi:hypothetical protein
MPFSQKKLINYIMFFIIQKLLSMIGIEESVGLSRRYSILHRGWIPRNLYSISKQFSVSSRSTHHHQREERGCCCCCPRRNQEE